MTRVAKLDALIRCFTAAYKTSPSRPRVAKLADYKVLIDAGLATLANGIRLTDAGFAELSRMMQDAPASERLRVLSPAEHDYVTGLMAKRLAP